MYYPLYNDTGLAFTPMKPNDDGTLGQARYSTQAIEDAIARKQNDLKRQKLPLGIITLDEALDTLGQLWIRSTLNLITKTGTQYSEESLYIDGQPGVCTREMINGNIEKECFFPHQATLGDIAPDNPASTIIDNYIEGKKREHTALIGQSGFCHVVSYDALGNLVGDAYGCKVKEDKQTVLLQFGLSIYYGPDGEISNLDFCPVLGKKEVRSSGILLENYRALRQASENKSFQQAARQLTIPVDLQSVEGCLNAAVAMTFTPLFRHYGMQALPDETATQMLNRFFLNQGAQDNLGIYQFMRDDRAVVQGKRPVVRKPAAP